MQTHWEDAMGSGKGFEGAGFAALMLLIISLGALCPSRPKVPFWRKAWSFTWRLGLLSLATFGLWTVMT